jgi:hypothetical protein
LVNPNTQKNGLPNLSLKKSQELLIFDNHSPNPIPFPKSYPTHPLGRKKKEPKKARII